MRRFKKLIKEKHMKDTFNPFKLKLLLLAGLAAFLLTGFSYAKDPIHAVYIPLADHYAGLIAHYYYADEMKKAEYKVELMKSWPSLRGKFMSGQVDLAFIICPMAMDMFAEKSTFKWISLIHRDGNALAANEIFAGMMSLKDDRIDRKPTDDFARAAVQWKNETGKASICGVPSLFATHTVVLYKYLKDNGLTLAVGEGNGDIIAKAVAPPKSPEFLKYEEQNGRAASFEQSLPWADVVETQNFGKVVWYSKDIMKWPRGHVECIIIATNKCINEKREALKEVIYYIHKAGRDIDKARKRGGESLKSIAKIINENYIPAHTVEAIMASLKWDLDVIKYSNLNIDKAGLKQIMDLAVEGGILEKTINIDDFADDYFSTDITSIE